MTIFGLPGTAQSFMSRILQCSKTEDYVAPEFFCWWYIYHEAVGLIYN